MGAIASEHSNRTVQSEIKEMAGEKIEDSQGKAGNAANEVNKVVDDAVKAGSDAKKEFDTAVEETKKIGNNAIDDGNNALKKFDTIAEEMKKLGNDAKEAFKKAGDELKKNN